MLKSTAGIKFDFVYIRFVFSKIEDKIKLDSFLTETTHSYYHTCSYNTI